MNVSFFMPTQVFLEENVVQKKADLVRAYGKKAMIVTGKYSAKRSGAYQDITAVLDEAAIPFVLFDQVENNPSLETVLVGAAFAEEEAVDFIIGIGGGSPLDAAKAVAVLAVNGLNVEALLQNNFKEALPILAIPTTAGTGSEVTPYSVLVKKDLETKVSFGNEWTFPKLALIDPKYTEAAPLKTILFTAVDAFTHSFEGYLSKRATPLSDALALSALAVFGQCLPALRNQEFSAALREKLMYVSLIGGLVITQTGVTSVHGMGYCYTYYQGIPHGQANAFLLRSYLAYVDTYEHDKIQQAMKVMGFSDTAVFLEQIDALVGKPRKLTDEEIARYTTQTMIQTRSLANTAGEVTEEVVSALWTTTNLESDS